MRTWWTTRTMRRTGAAVAVAVLITSMSVAGSPAVVTATGSPGTPSYLDDADVTPDTVPAEPDLASIGNRVWWDLDDDGVQDDSEPGLSGVDVTVLYLGADGVVGGGDDEAHTVTTGASGDYLVDHLPGGNYRVTVESADLPAGFVPIYDLDGGVFSPNDLWAGALAPDAAKRDVDFGYDGSGAIGDTVWFDQDADGVHDADEPGLEGVTVTVTWLGPDGNPGGADDRAFVTTTDADGDFLVDHLPAGPHTVAVGPATLPAGFTTQTGDPDAVMDGSGSVTLTSGAINSTVDFGYAGTASIGDTVWFDRDGDGTRDGNDDGIPGVTVTLTWLGPDGIAGGGDDVAFVRTTGAAGGYSFAHLPAGGYVVEASGLPPDYVNTFDADLDPDSSTAVALVAGRQHLTADFGYRGATSLRDRVWWDIDADGSQDPTEPGLGGVDVTVTDAGPDGSLGNGDDIVVVSTTDIDGGYVVAKIPRGLYTVQVTGGVPVGMTATAPIPSAAAPVTAFGYVGSGSIGDLVYLDLDGSGSFGAGDQGVPGVDVALTWAGGDDVFGTLDDIAVATVTDAAGTYVFAGLPAGEFRVGLDRSDLPGGLVATADPDGGADDTSDRRLTTGQVDLQQDFGFDGTGSIGDTVWLDLDGDGEPGAGEPGLAVVDLTVTWAGVDGDFGTGDDVADTDVTDADGRYQVDRLPAGSYRVAVDTADLPRNVVATIDPDGGADNGSALTLSAGVHRVEQDFGYRGDASIGDRVWIDVDGDGEQDPLEPGAAGLTVTVLAAGLDTRFGSPDDISIHTLTDEAGHFSATGLPAGPVRVSYLEADLATGFAPSTDRDGADPTSTALTLASGDAPADVGFGVRGTASLAGVVWNDADAGGVQDPGEAGIAGVTVEAVWTGPAGPVRLSVITGPDGEWLFADLPPGSYRVTIAQDTVPSGLVPSTPVSVASLVPPGGAAVAQHGETTSASVGDLVWLDTDRDGVHDADEPGLAGVTVRRLDPSGAAVDSAVTDASGRYVFEDLRPGVHHVEVDVATVPPGQQQYADPDGVIDAQSWVTAGPGDALMAEDFSFGPLSALPITESNPWRNLALAVLLVGSGVGVLCFGCRRRAGTGNPGTM